MSEQPQLTDEEWGLVLELLESERRDLPVEIRHTFRSHVHDELQKRLRTIDAVIEKLKAAPVA
jgi:hypothetical protein